MAEVMWSHLDQAVIEQSKNRSVDILAPYRAAAYSGGIPFARPQTVSRFAVQGLLKSMAETLTTDEQLSSVFVHMNLARNHGMALATADAGNVLIARAEGKPGFPELPEFWAADAQAAFKLGAPGSSAAYWAAAMLRAGQNEVPSREVDGGPGEGSASGLG